MKFEELKTVSFELQNASKPKILPFAQNVLCIFTTVSYLWQSHKIEEKVISISLANYSSIVKEIERKETTTNTDIPPNGNIDDLSIETKDEQEIEKSILQQLFYKNNNKNTPASRFKVLENNTSSNIFLTILVTLSTVSILFLTFQFFDNIFQISPSWWLKWWFIGGSTIIAITTFSLIVYAFINRKYIKSIQVGEFHFEKNEAESISVFNQYLDEIIYFFQMNSFEIMIIEDLDRFNNLDIFSKLKELNTLLNNNDQIKKKHKKITFVYAVKDSMFKNEEERSKFFEFILPVIPSITSDNVNDELSTELKKLLNLDDIPLSSQLVVDISDYISSRRILNNIISDFIIHMSLLNIDSNSDKRLDKLFSLMLLKNVLPLEYERLQSQNEESTIYSILKGKKATVQSNLCKKFNLEIDNLNDYFLELDKEKLKNINELSYLLLGVMLNEHSNFVSLTSPIESFEGVSTLSYQYQNRGGYSTLTSTQDLKLLEEKYFDEPGYFFNREQKIINKSKEKYDELVIKKNKLTEQTHKILNMTFFEMYELYSEQFPDELFQNDLIRLLLVNGYIDETHMDYLSDHKHEFISYNDKQIKQRINRKEKIGVFEKVDSPERLIISLEENRFNSTNILNFDIAKELIKNPNSYKEKNAKFIECFKRNDNVSKSFVEEIVSSNFECDEFICKLTKEKAEIFEWIYTNSTLLEEKKNSILWSIINSSNITAVDFSLINKSGVLAEFINHSSDFCNKYNNKNCDIKDLDAIVSIELVAVDKFAKNKYSEYILKNNRYCFSIQNINTILSDYYGISRVSITTKNYEVVSELPECSLKTRIFDSINGYLRNLYNKIDSGNLSPDKLTELLINKDIDLENKVLIVSKEVAVVAYNTQLYNETVEQLICKEQITLTITDVLNLYDKIKEELIVNYINNHSESLEFTKNTLEENETFKLFFFDNIDISKYLDKIGNDYQAISKFSNADNILLLIQNQKCLYFSNDFCEFCLNDKILKEYCINFDKEILDDITLQKIDFTQEEVARLYKISKESNLCFLNEIIKLIGCQALDLILKLESANEFYITIGTFKVLTKECKIALLDKQLNIEHKESLLCQMRELNDIEWEHLLDKTIKFRDTNYKYTPKNYNFYQELKRRNIKCNKYGKTIVFEKNRSPQK